MKVLRPGQPALDGTLVRASDLLVRLTSGEFLNVQRDELAFTAPPPRDWLQGGVAARFEVAGQGQLSGEVSYHTRALSRSPRYELKAAGSQARLAALAEIRNLGGEAWDALNVDLFAGEVRNVYAGGLISEQQAGRTGAATSVPTANLSVPVSPVSSVGELRGLQRYTLAGGLKLGRGETLTVPFVQAGIAGFTRYDSISAYFDRQAREGRASRHYRFTPDKALPAGPLSVREEGALAGTVQLPAAQAGRAVALDLGADNELRYARSVKELGQEKNPAGKVRSTTYQVTYTLTSMKTRPVRVQVRKQVYGRPLAVDGQAVQGQQVTVERRVDVPAGGQATLTFRLKLGAG